MRRINTVIFEKLIVISHIIKGWCFTNIWYKKDNIDYNPTAVAVVDGRLYSGGLTDRFIGIVSLYAWCKRNNRQFRIQYTSPFDLCDYVVPAQYNWVPRPGDYVQSSSSSFVVYGIGETRADKRLDRIVPTKQIHYYGNRDLLIYPGYKDYEWGTLFKELFKPSLQLQLDLDAIRANLPKDYFSIVFRFQNLLGDFPEYNFKSLDTNEQKEALIEKCLQAIIKLKGTEQDKHCLITSDSITFLKRAQELDNTYIIPGNMVHLGSEINGTYEQYEKSFLDFYILAESTKIYNVVIDNMYPSGFPKFAAKVNNIPFMRKYF